MAGFGAGSSANGSRRPANRSPRSPQPDDPLRALLAAQHDMEPFANSPRFPGNGDGRELDFGDLVSPRRPCLTPQRVSETSSTLTSRFPLYRSSDSSAA
jgi:hypothetical protein